MRTEAVVQFQDDHVEYMPTSHLSPQNTKHLKFVVENYYKEKGIIIKDIKIETYTT